ncbi:MAG: squalene/phytoene synthase family protein [Acidobacteria bacterium]|nr:squalene/phytoene synthase family protein [Acidobacteriota bacterium]
MAVSARERLEDLLEKTSRTFALSIPPLPEPTRREVTVAYLLFRIADTLEDATLWDRERRLAELAAFDALLESTDEKRARACAQSWVQDPPLDHAGYVELLAETPAVLRAWSELGAEARELVGIHTRRTIAGMSGFVERERDGVLELSDVEDMRRYCYAVAGIVGEMLTELFLLDRPQLLPVADELRRDAAHFGEALQLVNILKDVAGDTDEGRRFLPAGVDPAEVFRLARSDLELARRYSDLLLANDAPRGIVEFTLMPVLLAWATLDRVAERGPGAKLTRPEVRDILKAMGSALDRGDLRGLHQGTP